MIFAAIALIPVIGWYQYAIYLQQHYGISYFFLGESFSTLIQNYFHAKFYRRGLGNMVDFYMFPVVFVIALLYLRKWIRSAQRWEWAMLVACVFYFFLSGNNAVHHYYYGLLVVPVLSILGSLSLLHIHQSQRLLQQGLVMLLLILCLGHSYFRTQNWFAKDIGLSDLIETKEFLDTLLPATEKIALFSNGDPTLLWFLERKAWLNEIDAISEARVVVLDYHRLKNDEITEIRNKLAQQHINEIKKFQRATIFSPVN